MTQSSTKIRSMLSDLPRSRAIYEERFWRKVEKTDGCWLWEGSDIITGGYGRVAWTVGGARKRFLVHRLSWELAFGEIPAGLFVLHRCDNPPCVRPDHLWLGTCTDNNRDREEKNRSNHVKGSRIGTSKLTEEQAVEIRRRYTGKRGEQMALAAEFGVTYGAIWSIVHGQSWKHV
jgi:HNH endonuclease